jgi:molecular chaperone HscC
MSPTIGIDLGTTNSLLAYLSDNGPRLISNASGDVLTPSVIGIADDGTLIVGAPAKELQVIKPRQCASLFKRHIGTEWSVRLGQRDFTAVELSGLLLRSLKRDAEAFFGEDVSRAVITVPAYFNNRQREATIRAGELAGLRVERILNEPTSAALAYGFHESGTDKTVLVFDLGGGTFDVSLVDVFDGTLEVRASSGECFLGGEDFTRTLAARVLENGGMLFEHVELENPKLLARLLRQCEMAKRILSTADTAQLRVPENDGSFADAAPAVIARHEFQQWTNHYLVRMELPMRRVLGDARIAWGDLDEVILAGGATRMPAVVEMVTRLSGRPPLGGLNPDEVVALGAAVQAGLMDRSKAVEDLVVTDVAPFTLGFETSKEFPTRIRDGYFTPVIFRNTTIPVSRVTRVVTLHPNQDQITIKIYQGEGRRVEENLLLGEFTAGPVPLGPAGSESVDVRFTYDLNGVLEVEATIVTTGKKCAHVVTRHAQGLTADQVSAAVDALSRLKMDTRDQEENRLLLHRAHRAYAELPIRERALLSTLLDGFEEALDLGQPQTIERHREALSNFLDEYDSADQGW